MLSVDEVARYFNVSTRTVEYLITSGEIRPIWIRRCRRFVRETIDAYVRSQVGKRGYRRRSS